MEVKKFWDGYAQRTGEKVPSLQGDPASQRSPDSHAARPTKMAPNPKGKTKKAVSRAPRSLLLLLTNKPLGKGATLEVPRGAAIGRGQPLPGGRAWGPEDRGEPGGGEDRRKCPLPGKAAELESEPEVSEEPRWEDFGRLCCQEGMKVDKASRPEEGVV